MYASDIETIDTALSLFADDQNGCHICSALSSFGVEMRIVGRSSSSLVSNITHDLWNISALCLRLNWMRGLAANGHLQIETWRVFSSLDIENLFVQVRSSMDYATKLMQAQLQKGGQLPESFESLRNSINKYRSRLPEDLLKIIEAAKWFDQMRGIRNAVVHKGGMSLVFGEPAETLLFQVYGKGAKGYAFHPALMFNENVVYFERYAALLIANLLVFLNSLGRILQSISQSSIAIGSVRSYSAGFSLVREWLVQTRHLLTQGEST